MRIVSVATCSLNQWAMDFDGNLERVKESIIKAKEQGCKIRSGPELELSGYSCNDHFLEADTYFHCWESLLNLLSFCTDIICDIGMPIQFEGCRFNCRVILYQQKILCIRPKMVLADSGNYRESRWFTAWNANRYGNYILPKFVAKGCGQISVPIGNYLIQTLDTILGCEVCEEMFSPLNPSSAYALNGVEIFMNGSASHHELGKLSRRIELVNSGIGKFGGVYMYSNQIGCDGERLYFDGCELISINGNIVAQGKQFSLCQVNVSVAVVDLDKVTSFRSRTQSFGTQSQKVSRLERIFVETNLSSDEILSESETLKANVLTTEDEIRLGPACWLWDILVKSSSCGFFLPLSGGIDSCSVALIVYSMCEIAFNSISDPVVEEKLISLCNKKPESAQEICNLVLTTCYMRTDQSSSETRDRAKLLASKINSNHLSFCFEFIFQSFISLTGKVLNFIPSFKGSRQQNVALQNLQARLRMVCAYFFAQLIPKNSFLLVLSSSNVDECLSGYFTKYDCSSADLNPIGSISKSDIRLFVNSYLPKFPFLKE